MPTIGEEYEAYRAQRQLSDEYGAWKKQQEIAAGGAITAPQPGTNDFANPPYGSVIGGLAGSIAGGVAAGPAGAVGGGLAGSVGGEAIQQGIEKLIGSPGAPQSGMESATRLGREALIGTGAELGGQALSLPFAGRRMFPGMPGKVTPQAKEAMRFLEPRYTKQALLPAEATDSSGLDVAQNIAENSLFGRGAIQKFKQRRYEEVFSKIADEMVDDLGPRLTPDQVGRMVVDSVNRNREVATMPATMLYRAVDQYAGAGYATSPTKITVKRMAEPLFKKEVVETPTGKTGVMGEPITKSELTDVPDGEQLKGLKVTHGTQEQQVSGAQVNLAPLKGELSGLLRIARAAGGLEDRAMGTNLMKFLQDKPDVVPYAVAKAMRTEVRAFSDMLKNSVETKNSPAIARANSIYAGLTNRIRAGLNEFDPFVAQMWDEANLIERGGQQQFNNKFIRKLVKSAVDEGGGKPEAIADKVLAPNNISLIRTVKNAVDPKDWDGILSVKMRNILQSAQAEPGAPLPTGNIIGKQLESAMFGPNGVGEKAMVAAYGPDRVKQYRQIVNALKLSQAPQGASTGSVAIQLLQTGYAYQAAGAVASAVGMSQEEVDPSVIGAGGALLFGPALMGRMMTTPGGAKWILEGMRIPPGTTRAAGWLGRGVSMLYPREERTRPDTAESRSMPTPPLTRPVAPQIGMPQYKDGTAYVPQTGPAKLHEGEMVIPKNIANAVRDKLRQLDIGSQMRSAAYGASNVVTQKIADMLGVSGLAEYAQNRPREIGVAWKGEGSPDYEDALRHILIAAELQRTKPILARPLLWAHEVSGDLLGQSQESRKMDDFNNQLGLAIGGRSQSIADTELQALNALPGAIANIPKLGY